MRPEWLPPGKKAAVCFSVDDVHPGKSTDPYEAGGDLEKGALGHLIWLAERHPQLRVTLFTTADWREIEAKPTYRLLPKIPYVRDRAFLTPIHPKGRMALDRHPEFVDFIRAHDCFEVGLHGLHHVHPGVRVPIEFQNQDAATCRRILQEAMEIFDRAELPFVRGMTPPGWNAPEALLDAMVELDLRFVASARDILTPISADAMTNMSGLKGVSLIAPEYIRGGRLLHIPSNFQATSPIERALEIAELGGLVAIKGHIVAGALDSVVRCYVNYLDAMLCRLEDRYGDALWWTTMGEISASAKVPAREEEVA